LELYAVARLIKKWFLVIILACFVGGGAGLIVSLLQPRVYEANTTVYLTTPNRSDSNDLVGAQQAAKAFALIPTSGSILTATLQTAHDKNLSLSQLSSMIIVDNARDTQFVVIHVRDSDPNLAARLATLITQQSVARFEAASTDANQERQFVRQEMDRLQIEITDLESELTNTANQTMIDQFSGKLSQDRTLYNQLLASYMNMSGIQAIVVQDAQVPQYPVVGVGWPAAVAIGMLVGLITIVAVITFIEQKQNILPSPSKAIPETGNNKSQATRGTQKEDEDVDTVTLPRVKSAPLRGTLQRKDEEKAKTNQL
jgi:uncharacterized protein involved in exopolysaccharide biosynthesis